MPFDDDNTASVKKIIIECPNCKQHLRIPRITKRLIVNCRSCNVRFNYNNHTLSLSIWTKRYLLSGLIGGGIGFFVSEALRPQAMELIPKIVLMIVGDVTTFIVLGFFIGAFLGATDGYYLKQKKSFYYGIKIGGLLGLLGGMFSGVVGEWAYRAILLAFEKLTLFSGVDIIIQTMIARTLGWTILGTLLGATYGIKENTIGDLKYGMLSGLIGGAIAGFLFDPLAWYFRGQDAFSRLIGFVILGAALGFAIKFFQERALKKNSTSLFKRLTNKLPNNLRLEHKL